MTLVRHMLHAQSSDTPATLQEQAKFSKCKKKKEGIVSLKNLFWLSDSETLVCYCRALRHTDSGRNPGCQSRHRINLQLQLKHSASSACARGEHVFPDSSLGRQRV